MKLHEIREARAAKVQQARALLDTAQGKLNADQQKTFDGLKSEITDLEGQEQRASFIEEAERRAMGQPADKQAAQLESRISITDAVLAQTEQRAVNGALGEYAAEMKRQGITARHGGVLVPNSVFEKRATMDTTGAAKITPDDYRPDQFVGLFRNALALRNLGARILTGLRGDTILPKQTGASSAYWIAEGDALTESNPTFDNLKLQPKHVGALSSVSRQLLQQANPSIEQLLRDDFVNVIGLAIDKAMLHGLAANDEPVGILNTTGIQTGSLATMDWESVIALMEKLALENITPNAIITHPAVSTALQTTLKDSVAGAEYLMQAGRMAGLPVNVTNQLVQKAGSPATGRVLVGDFSQLVVGEWQAAELLANPYATGYYEAGAIQLRILATMDMVVRNPKAIVSVDDVGL